MLDIKEHSDGVVIKIKVQPRSSKNQISGVLGDALKVMLTAPPVDGEANAACIDFFASVFKIAKTRVKIISGHTGRIKLVKIFGLNKSELLERLKS